MTSAHGEGIAHGVDPDVAAELARGVYEPVTSFAVGVGEGEARHADVVGAAGGGEGG